MDKIIEVKDLKKSYGNFLAVKGISFDVVKGSLFAFLGTNGAGKSTTIDILSTLNSYDSGEVKIAGFDLKTQSNQIKSKIGVVFQDSVLDGNLTVKENLKIKAGLYYKSSKQAKIELQNVIETCDISNIWKKKYKALSGGQKRRVDIARALICKPEILFLDEPTTGLDPQTRKAIWNTIKKLQIDYNTTIFLTTHYMEEAAQADFITIIDAGQIIAQGTPFELKAKYTSEHIQIKPLNTVDAKDIILDYLTKNDYEFIIQNDYIDVKISDTKKAMSILIPIMYAIDSYQVLYGSMDDVFLNITGKELDSNETTTN
ncbi:ABC transporter ATP-binding protein [Mycoplasma nasistruthionis]|uniref:ABC transporter ATP-binding protein n=1 Tax=Mycoplasma nasistruthionis TaxID=353852 RepID=A0A4Y6I5B2_9MOLU|nr:ABC transporter ATP-binding protein [Mycoplasma nasistruthionis]QDF64794.1 ABC transporter ATP-binding protein [Mycoplasma nasistruthionis]